jgi:hypothetical protein
MNTIEINQDQFRELLKNPNDKSFVMLNLLKFKKMAAESHTPVILKRRTDLLMK